MRVKVILNPKSDRGRGIEHREAIIAYSRQHGGVDLVLTERPGQGTELARQAVAAGYDVIVAAGGDGTVHEVVNGLHQAAETEAVLGVIPIGSGNDFAYGLGILADVETAVQRVFSGQPRVVDLARIEDDQGRVELFANNFGFGFDATVAIETRKITHLHGFLMYLLAVLRTVFFYYDRPRVQVDFDGESVSQNILFLAMGIGPRSGGGFMVVPQAKHDDDLIDSCTVNAIGRLTMLLLIPKTIKGTHVTSRHVTMRQNRRITIRSDVDVPIHTDGEIFAYPGDQVRQVTVTSLPGALKVMV